MSRLEAALRRIAADLKTLNRRSALVGGLAVSVRSEPRFTRDIDLAVAVATDTEAESLARHLQARGYGIVALVEHESRNRLATARLGLAEQGAHAIVVDLLFASSGIENEIVDAAEEITVFAGFSIAVAQRGHLLAQKLLARDDKRRPQDIADILALIRIATPDDIREVRRALLLIESRGFNRQRNLAHALDELLKDETS